MALHGQPNSDNQATRPQSIGFQNNLVLMGGAQSSEYTNTIVRIMSKKYEQVASKPAIHILDREHNSTLSYSYIVVSLAGGNGEVYYHVTLLEETGLKPLTASGFVSAVTDAIRERNAQPKIYTPSDAYNPLLNDLILKDLGVSYPKAKNFISVDGVVLHSSNIELEDLALRVAAIAYNSVYTEGVLSNGNMTDLNLSDALNADRNTFMKIEQNVYATTVPNFTGTPTRQDFKLDLVQLTKDTGFELNDSARKQLVSVGGYIEAIAEAIPMQQQQMGMQPVSINRLHPNIVLTNIDTISPTAGFMMLGVATGGIMTAPELWLNALTNMPAHANNNPGVLNILTNIENGQAGVPLDFSAKDVTPEEQQAAIYKMYSLAPILSIDIEVYGPQSYYTSLLAAAVTPSAGNIRTEALHEIVDVCVQLTNGHFPATYNIDEIFTGDGVVIPLGYWMDKTGERDIRDIDLAFVAKHTNDIQTVNKWNTTSFPRALTGIDPFLTRTEIISTIIPDSIINGKAIRATFTSAFVQTLTAAMERCGVSARYEATTVINQNYSTTQFTDYLSSAGLSGNGGFARQNTFNGSGYSVPYGYMGQY